MRRTLYAFAGITAGLIALFTPTAQATSPQPADHCKRVARADRALCHQVQRQHPYGHVGATSSWSVPSGRAIVRDITHSGLTKTDMHYALKAEAASYRANVTHVRVNMDAVLKRCGSDGQMIVRLVDEDGKPDGRKLTEKVIDCP